MKIATLVLIGLLVGIGIWANGAAIGYERGKSDALAASRPSGLVVIKRDGACEVFDKANQIIPVEYGHGTGHIVMMVRLAK